MPYRSLVTLASQSEQKAVLVRCWCLDSRPPRLGGVQRGQAPSDGGLGVSPRIKKHLWVGGWEEPPISKWVELQSVSRIAFDPRLLRHPQRRSPQGGQAGASMPLRLRGGVVGILKCLPVHDHRAGVVCESESPGSTISYRFSRWGKRQGCSERLASLRSTPAG